MFTYGPTAAAIGIETGIVKVQFPSAGKNPPASVIMSVPETVDPAPHVLLIGVPVVTAPDNIASRSSVNDILVAALFLSRFIIVKIRFVVPPGNTGLVSNDFDIANLGEGITERVAIAGDAKLFGPNALVTFSKSPVLIALT